MLAPQERNGAQSPRGPHPREAGAEAEYVRATAFPWRLPLCDPGTAARQAPLRGSLQARALAPEGADLGDLPASLLAAAHGCRKEWAQGLSLR